MISLRPLSALNLRHSIKRFSIALAAFGLMVLLSVVFYVTRAAGTGAWTNTVASTAWYTKTNASTALTNTNGAAAQATTVYVDDDWAAVPDGADPDGTGPATQMGFDAFSTVQAGVNGVATGGTVNVAAGNYPEQVTISKSLTLIGEGAATTNITTPASLTPGIGGNLVLMQVDSAAVVDMSGITVRGPRVFNGCSEQIFYGVYVAGAANLNLHDAAVRDIRMADPALFGCQDGNAIRAGSNALSQTATLSVTNVEITGYQKTGIIVDGTGTSATITDATLTGFGPENLAQNAVQIGRGAGASVTGSTITNNECNNPSCGPDQLTESFGTGFLVFATSAPVSITNNTISDNDTGIYNNAANTTISGNTMAGNRFNGIYLDEGAATISNNTLSGTSNVGITAVSFTAADFTTGNSTGTLTGNTITGAATGLQLLDADAGDTFVPQLTAHFNRIVTTTTAIDDSANQPASLENNWWGCNAGPGNTGCGAVQGTGAVFSPWFVLSVSASPSAIVPGGTSTVSVDMTHNSDGGVPADTLPDLPVAFSATNGTMTPASATVHDGAASSTFTSTNASNATATATVDNQSVSANITVTAPTFSINDVTHAEGHTGTTPFVFTVTKSGATALSSSVDFTTVDGTATTAGDDYQSNSGTLTFAAEETTKQITVLVKGDRAIESNETFTVHLSNAVEANITDADGTGTITNDDAAPNVVYVDDDWALTPDGTDPDGAGPAIEKGYDAFAKIQDGVNAVATGGTVNVYAGTYNEDVAINKVGLSLLGIGAGTKTIVGAIGGDGATIRILSSNVTVADFQITRAGNNTTDWNNPNLNSAGIAIQGTAITGALIRDNVITGNRTAIDINNSGGHTIRNNSITDNRTGLFFRNQTDGLTVVENFITNNWTVGVLFIDGSGGTNSPVQSALHSTFSNNDISGNWYGQIVDRQSDGSIPAPGTINLKNFRGDWLGTTSPVVTTANSAEPAYAAQIPVEFGGTATPPGGQPDIAGPASANLKYQPFLLSGTDTNIETTPGRGTNGFQGVPNTVVVTPANQQGWVFFNDNPGVGSGSGGFEVGPATPPLGDGSAFLQVDAEGRHALGTAAYAGTRMDDITELGYYSYQNNNDPSTVFAISLQFDIDYDLTDANNSFQGRLVFEPYLTPATIEQNVWQNWDAMAGKWYGTRTTVTAGNAAGVANPCQQATPCTWQQVLALFPNAGVRNTPTSAVLFKAGGPWSPGFRGNVDDFRININAAKITYDFEPDAPTLSIDDVTHAEGNSGTTDYTFTVTLSRPTIHTVTVSYATADDSATTADGDYSASSGTLTFNPGETTKQVTVTVNGDTKFEPDEQFFVNLSTPSNATILDSQGTGTITNDDDAPTFSITDVTLAEGNTGLTNFVFHVTKSGATSLVATVQFATADGTATAPSDYNANSGTLTFAPAETDKTITVAVHGDTVYEANETFFVNLSIPTNATLADGQGTGVITNDDKPPTTLVVNTTNDIDDGFCLADHCSLREAINASNANVDVSTITFAIPTTDAGRNTTTGVYTIMPGSPLPTASRRVVIDGYSQTPCASNPVPCSHPNTLTTGDDAVLLIELDGTNAGTLANGLTISAGTSTVTGLVINRFGGHGIALQTNGSDVISGNFIGTNAAGNGAFGNGASGVAILSSSGNTIGGASAAARNLISANGANGIQLASSNTLQGNYIGTDASGTTALGNTASGVASLGGFSHVIGGAAAGEGNLISGNGGDGISLANGNSILVQGNLVGTKADGTSALGNGANGISFSGVGSVFNTVGGTAAGEANTIAFNGGDGVHIDATAGNGHALRGNSIYSNGNTPAHLGIDLGADGVTPNDPADTDTGANSLQNFPVITTVLVTGSTRNIAGTLNSTPNQSFTIDFYSNAACDDAGNGEGQTYLGSVTTATTDANGDVSFTFHPTALSPGQFVTATATNTLGSTSEFSQCAAAAAGTAGTIEFTAANYEVTESGGTATITVTRTGGSDGSITAYFSTSDGTATAPADYDAVSYQSITYADGETGTKSVPVTIKDDSLFEGDETVNLSLSTTTINARRGGAKRAAASPAGTSATLTIHDDETPPSFSIDDVLVPEPQSGTSNATFTVTLSSAAEIPVSVSYATSDGTATAPADYDATSGTLTFAPGETSHTFTVVIKSDALSEGTETFTANLSNPTASTTIFKASGTGTIADLALSGQIIISEFRFHGAQGPQDEFIELYNTTANDITVVTDDGTPGWALAATTSGGSSVDLLKVIENGTIIPAHGHFLLADAPTFPAEAQGYSLGVTPSLTYDCDIPDDAGVALFRTAEPASFNTGTRLDAAGFSAYTTPEADLFREGAGLTSPGDVSGEYSFVRDLLTGLPRDTNDNAADFIFVSTDGGVYGTVSSTLGAPGPENRTDPILRSQRMRAALIDANCPGVSSTPGDACARYRDSTPGDANHSQFGTLSIRRKFNNNTGASISRLRFRIVDITTRAGGSEPPTDTADVRALTSVTYTATLVGGGTTTVKGLTLEAPAQPLGGGLNSTLAAGDIIPAAPLAPGDSINVEFRLGVEQTGSFRFFVIVEAVLDSDPVSPSAAPAKHGPGKPAPATVKMN